MAATNVLGIAVGANDTVLTADSAVDAGYKWAAAGASLTGITDSASPFTTALGTDAASLPPAGLNNVCIGYKAGEDMNAANQNVAIGANAFKGAATSTCNDCVVIGNNALPGHRAQFDSVFIGASSGVNSTSGLNSASNTCVGYFTAVGITGGDYNTAIGANAGQALTSGSNNTFLGKDAGLATSTGTNNTCIGFESGEDITGSGNVTLGCRAGETQTAISNQLWIANTNTTTPLIYGEFDNNLVRFNGEIGAIEKSANPTAPAEGRYVMWMSDGTGHGDDGDVLIASTAGATTNYAIVFDHSAGAAF